MSKFVRFILTIMVLGALLAVAGFSDAKMLMSGKTVNINDASLSDFGEKALCEGNIAFVYGPFCTLETSQKRYGVTTSKTETDFFIIGNRNLDCFAVFSTSDTALKSRMANESDKWVDFLSDENAKESDRPLTDISFKGKLWQQLSEDEYKTYYNEAVDDLTNIGIGSDEYAELRIVGGEVDSSALFIFFGGIALFLVGAGIFAAGIVSAKKKEKEAALY